MFCSNCGKEIEDGMKFCTNCGNRIDSGISAVQSDNQTAMPSVQGIPNSTINTANKTATCQGCLLNKNMKCTYYDCAISDAEKYDCGMRDVPELQKKQRNSGIILLIVVLVISSLFTFFNVYGKIAVLTGISFFSSWLGGMVIWLPICLILYFILTYRNKKRRDNAKRLS